jgi:hypothetical protein
VAASVADVCRPVVGQIILDLYLVGPSYGLPTRPYPLSAYVVLFTRQCTWMPNLFALEIHASARRNALSKFAMPAMSPTMTEGGIAQWKVKEGQKYATGDVLLEIVRILFVTLFRVMPIISDTRKRTRLPLMWRRRRMVFSQKLL